MSVEFKRLVIEIKKEDYFQLRLDAKEQRRSPQHQAAIYVEQALERNRLRKSFPGPKDYTALHPVKPAGQKGLMPGPEGWDPAKSGDPLQSRKIEAGSMTDLGNGTIEFGPMGEDSGDEEEKLKEAWRRGD